MHVPDGFLDVPTSVATGVVAVAVVGAALRRAEREIAETGPALPGLAAAFVFAAQMVNFPVGAGTSGHLLGGALAAALVGPWAAVVVLTSVLLVQGLLFADGGLTALGTNVVTMGVVGVLVGYAVTWGVLRLVRRVGGSWAGGARGGASGAARGGAVRGPAFGVVPAAAVGAFVSVPAAAGVFTVLYAIGGAVAIPLPRLAAAMVGWHVVIGVGEAVITAAVLGAVVATRPDLVQLVRAAEAGDAAEARGPAEAGVAGGSRGAGPARVGRRAVGIAAGVTLLVAGGLSLLASSSPDGLEHVAASLGFGGAAATSAAGASPLADYAVRGLDGPLSGSVAGVVGALVTVGVAFALGWVALRSRARAGRRADRP